MIAASALVIAAVCAAWIVIDIAAGHRQPRWIMNIVWPITALYSGPIGLWAYFSIGRQSAEPGKRRPTGSPRPFWQSVAIAASHCGGGCTIADILGEWGLFVFPVTLLGADMFAAWLVDYILALLFGIFFQFFSLDPTATPSVTRRIITAAKADFLSLTAWQVGMYGWMAMATFVLFGAELPRTTVDFWFMMQIAMLAGFVTSYPVNWWLLRAGIKEAM